MKIRRLISHASLLSLAAGTLLFFPGLFSGKTFAATDIVEGNPSSPVRVIVYDDMQSANCAQLRILLDEKILPHYGRRIALIHRDFPAGKHDWARPAAIAGHWIYEHNPQAGITFRREIMAEQNNITLQKLKPWLSEFAVRNQLDGKALIDSLTDERLISLVDQQRQGALARGVPVAPSIYIGGVKLTGTLVYDDIARALDAALAQ